MVCYIKGKYMNRKCYIFYKNTYLTFFSVVFSIFNSSLFIQLNWYTDHCEKKRSGCSNKNFKSIFVVQVS